MSSNDPFDIVNPVKETLIRRPTPEGKRAPDPHESLSVESPNFEMMSAELWSLSSSAYSNIFIAESISIIFLATQIRSILVYKNVGGLFQRVVGEIQTFENSVIEKGVTEADSRIAKLFLCALIDEAVLNTPWGHQSDWKHENLSNYFFKQAHLGGIFYQETDKLKLKHQFREKLELLKLAYVCLSLGFQGKYRLMSDGHRQVAEARDEIYQMIRNAIDEPDRNLSEYWQGRSVKNPLIRYIPLWVVAAGACLFLLVSFAGFLYFISRSASVTLAQNTAPPIPIEEISIPEEKTVQSATIPSDSDPISDTVGHFRKLFESEIEQNLVEVLDGSPLILRMSNTFLSGKDEIKKEFHGVFTKLAREIKDDDSRINIFGHTDNQPIRFSIKFPDNYTLSVARAKSAAEILLESEPTLKDRVHFEGKSDWMPVVPNDSEANRAINRRIDIHIR